MSIETQQPPLRQGDRVRFIFDRDHVETIESCEWIEGPHRHWRVITRWHGGLRVAHASEFVIEGAAP